MESMLCSTEENVKSVKEGVRIMDRKLDGLGRLVIPKVLRDYMGVANNDSLEILVCAEGLLLRRKSHD